MGLTTIWQLLNNSVAGYNIKRGIEIPMIQRDYAQGRKNNKANEIRKIFLGKIRSSVKETVSRGANPLELDFVYGFIDSETFIPLDGQQRLTTLYLLHWYLAFKEKKLNDYVSQFSKFAYQTRQSSEDFFKKINTKLTDEDYQSIFHDRESFAKVITNKNWYFIGWKYDLTIQSAITMLDEIHVTFQDAAISFADLINEDRPSIVFNFLDIKNFGLSDDLYIKMNSRGKPLTNFENLKAELGRFIESSDFNNKYSYHLKHSGGEKAVNVETYFATRTDTSWSDFFWKIRNKSTNEFDDKLLNILAFVALNEIVKKDVARFEYCLKNLDKNELDLSFYLFQTLGILTEDSIVSYINFLDVLVSKEESIVEYFKEDRFLNKHSIVEFSYENNFKARYEQRILFYAVFKFLIVHKINSDQVELARWDRLVRNLVINTLYRSSKEFADSIVDIDKLINAYDGNIYETFLQLDIKGFDNQQIKEEKLKIQLMKKSRDWVDLILLAESHSYLEGQIIFLLAFSGIYDKYLANEMKWSEEEDKEFFEAATDYYEKFKGTFTDTGLKPFDKELFRRALLTKGDYLLYSTNKSLLIDNHRDISWKRLLKETGNRNSEYFMHRCGYLKSLFDDIQVLNIEGSLQTMVKESTANDWRRDFIQNPILIEQSKEKYLKFFEDGRIYVLRKSKYIKSADPEVKILLLKKHLIKNGFEEKDIELGYIDSLNQYGITRIRGLKPKVVFNHDGGRKYFLKQRGKGELITNKRSEIIKYIVENF